MKTIAGAILIVAASIFYHARTELEDRKIGYDDRMGLIRTCKLGAGVIGAAGILLIGADLLISGANARRAKHVISDPAKRSVED